MEVAAVAHEDTVVVAAQVWQIPVVAADAATVMALPMPGDLAALEW